MALVAPDISSTIEKLSMASGTNESQFDFGKSIEQKPVGLDVTIPMPQPVATETVGPATMGQRLFLLQQVDKRFQLVGAPSNVFAKFTK